MKSTSPASSRKTALIFWLSIAVFLIALAAYAGMFYLIQKTGEENATLRAETDQLTARESQVGELKRTLSSIQAKEPMLGSYFINANDIVPFLEMIEEYGRQTRVSVKFTNVDLKQGPPTLFVSVTSSGTFTDIYRFLSLVEAAPYQIKITQTTMQVGTQTTVVDPKAPVQSKPWDLSLSLTVTSVTNADTGGAK
ncbi:MAG: hypothetical protein KA052_00310 [Candidatus Pacebacteria bacterium]|nr:hypothetical protein [Candidatus Paceibacterota bacterium]